MPTRFREVIVGQILSIDNSPEALEVRTFLIKLSGTQIWDKQESSNLALLAGLWVFLSVSKIMEAYFKEELEALKATAK